MFSAGGPGEDCPSGPSLSLCSLTFPQTMREREKMGGGGEEAKMWLCANRTQRHSETLAVLFFRSEAGD